MIDADPDYSADFAIALAAITTYSATASEALFEFANKLDASFPHTCLRYTEEDDSWLIKPSMHCEDSEEWVKQWNETILTPSDQHLIQDFIKPRPIYPGGKLLTLPPSFRYATQISCPGQVIIVTSNTCRRKIFDLVTRQVVTASLRTSLSERNSQANLVHRIDAPAQSTHILMRPDYLTKCPPTMRRMRILNDQLGGFLTGLTQFNPRGQYMSALLRSLKKYMDNHHMVVTDMMNRLVSQQLCDWASSNSLLSLKVENPKVYYTILDQVDYNHHIAYFLSIPSDDSWINMIKVKIASALASGYPDTVHLTGMATSGLAHSHESSTDVNERIDAFLKRDLANGICTGAEESFGTLRSLLVANSITVGEPTPMRVLTKPEYLVICEHLLLAFAHQVAVVDFSTGENVFHDHLSGVKLEASLEVQVIVNLQAVKERSNADRVFGVYTTLARRRDGRTAVCDWTWIPPQVWDKWSDKLELYTRRKPNDIWALRPPRYNEGETIGKNPSTDVNHPFHWTTKFAIDVLNGDGESAVEEALINRRNNPDMKSSEFIVDPATANWEKVKETYGALDEPRSWSLISPSQASVIPFRTHRPLNPTTEQTTLVSLQNGQMQSSSLDTWEDGARYKNDWWR
ncbi:hypothetical protein FPHYL_7560 [Fusarium phyllophilum]|uniref:Uncharacterized protein n=1 Tax=Fusarium phyllophilum TaxID=47803 RepID=A0A8H5NAQ3_9HYPO|nr:hypothetical protein FPHYL_7560 [Fusarium phyllophilum]